MNHSGNTLRLLKSVAQAFSVAQKIRVLLVDDDEALLRLLPLTMERLAPGRYEVQSVSTVAESMRLLMEHTFEVCLIDYDLKDRQTGIDVIRACQEKNVEIPFIVITGMAKEDEILKEALEQSNCMGYLAKDVASMRVVDELIQFSIRNFAMTCIARRHAARSVTPQVQMCWQAFVDAGAMHCHFVLRPRMECA